MKRAAEKWRAGAFEYQRRASVCLHTPFGLVKRWGGKGRATVIGDKTMYTNSGFRGGIKCHQTNWTYLLSGSDEFYFDKPTLILASSIEYLQLAMLLNGALWRVWNVQSKTRATVQDSCFWLQLMKWHDNVSTKQQIGWFHFEWQQHLRCTSCSNKAAYFLFDFEEWTRVSFLSRELVFSPGGWNSANDEREFVFSLQAVEIPSV